MILNSGLETIAENLVGTGVPFNAANAHICVGNGTAAAVGTQTDLQGTQKFRKAVDAGFPVVTGSSMQWQVTMDGTEANFAWEEFGVANAATLGDMLIREVQYNGTKVAGQSWVFKVNVILATV